MRKSTKLIGAVGVAALTVAASSAFTAGGLTAPASSFVGGSVSQSITGATLSNIAYDTNEATNKISSVTLTFSTTAVDTKTPTLAFSGAVVNGIYTCAAVEATGHTSLCTAGATIADTNATSVTVTVE